MACREQEIEQLNTRLKEALVALIEKSPDGSINIDYFRMLYRAFNFEMDFIDKKYPLTYQDGDFMLSDFVTRDFTT